MSFVPIDLPPGIAKNSTEYANKGRWTDGNLIRWVNRKMQPVGGWALAQTAPITAGSPIRELFSWVDLALDPWTALGSNDKLFMYVRDTTQPTDDRIIDVTPVDLGSVILPGFGYGAGDYGEGRYGVSTSQSQPGVLALSALWDFDNFGEDLLAVHSGDGRIFRMKPSDQTNFDIPVPAIQLSNSPIDNLGVIVSEERHVIAFGAGGDLRRIEWSSQEDPEDWAPTATNTAGGINIQTTGAIVGAVRVRGGILVITTTDAHLMRFLGPPFQYSVEHVGDNCGAFGQQTVVGDYDRAFWMGQDRFWYYDGVVKRLECEVLEHVFEDVNRSNPFSFSSGANTRFSEIWWFYPSSGSGESDRYAFFSYRDTPHWGIGELSRTAFHDNMVYQRPLGVDEDGNLFFHEFGYLDNGNPRGDAIFAETSPLDIANGERVVHIKKLFQDAFVAPSASPIFPYQIELKMRPAADGGVRTAGPYTINSSRGYTDVRAQGRQAQVRVINTEDQFWELGTMRFDVVPGGRRGF